MLLVVLNSIILWTMIGGLLSDTSSVVSGFALSTSISFQRWFRKERQVQLELSLRSKRIFIKVECGPPPTATNSRSAGGSQEEAIELETVGKELVEFLPSQGCCHRDSEKLWWIRSKRYIRGWIFSLQGNFYVFLNLDPLCCWWPGFPFPHISNAQQDHCCVLELRWLDTNQCLLAPRCEPKIMAYLRYEPTLHFKEPWSLLCLNLYQSD